MLLQQVTVCSFHWLILLHLAAHLFSHRTLFRSEHKKCFQNVSMSSFCLAFSLKLAMWEFSRIFSSAMPSCRSCRRILCLLLLPWAAVCAAEEKTCLLQVPRSNDNIHAHSATSDEPELPQGPVQIIALDCGVLHGPANTLLAAKRAVGDGAMALNVDAVLSGRQNRFQSIHYCVSAKSSVANLYRNQVMYHYIMGVE